MWFRPQRARNRRGGENKKEWKTYLHRKRVIATRRERETERKVRERQKYSKKEGDKEIVRKGRKRMQETKREKGGKYKERKNKNGEKIAR